MAYLLEQLRHWGVCDITSVIPEGDSLGYEVATGQVKAGGDIELFYFHPHLDRIHRVIIRHGGMSPQRIIGVRNVRIYVEGQDILIDGESVQEST